MPGQKQGKKGASALGQDPPLLKIPEPDSKKRKEASRWAQGTTSSSGGSVLLEVGWFQGGLGSVQVCRLESACE